MISAYEHGRNAAKHAKHIQACPFDTGTPEMAQVACWLLRLVANLAEQLL
jgi:hypothetical protein